MGRMEHPAWRRAEGESLKYFIEDPSTGTLYRRGQLLGKGAFGRCYKFTDTSTNKVYAVKVVPQSRVSRLDNRGKVEREIELHSQLKHRNVVGFHRHFADQENIYMVLEYCSRKSLAHILKVRKTLTEPEVRFYLKQVIAGLQYLHQQGIIHRDLKLSNFFITKTMQVKIGDLGLATREEQASRRRGVVCGTPNYLAPEVIAKKGHSFKSDVWALGCIMYTALTGCSPFEITHKQEMYRCIREGRYPTPSRLSPSARGLIAKLLAPNPESRPTLEETLAHEFFTQGFTPTQLPSRACHSAPLFMLPNPLRKFFQKVAKVFLRGTLCQETRTVSPPPQEAEGMLPPGTPAETPSLEVEEESQNGTEDPATFPVCLLMRGSLNVSREEADAERSMIAKVDEVLRTCLKTIPLAEEDPEGPPRPGPIQMVTKWVDYSNKYGFSYLLSGGSTGVLLADGTHIALCPQRQRVCYCPELHEASSFPRRDVPPSLTMKMGILHFFSRYMQQRLLEGGHQQASPATSLDNLCLLHFAKSQEALLMLFSDGTLQVNFYHDRTKLVLSPTSAGGYLLTFVDRQRQSRTFPLETLVLRGWTIPLRERLSYARSMLHCL
ncbi:serine/threonine-protein kinase PLK2-like isoform X1 [Lacerta agilis]|uniref:serine/threonine-protein kinase PLK2-like isoform X1 n=1 Tax=Lacerta agilis TaxID=80427 RepID=UPI001419F70D|nr:serine/threonine-protein kinase PLK2-like isoform X1 [Lacerta agilis]